MIIANPKMPSFLISVRFLCVILIFFGYCLNFMQKIDMSIAIVCMTNHTAIKMLQQTNSNKTSFNNFTNYHYNTSISTDSSCPLIISSSARKYVYIYSSFKKIKI